MTSLWYHTLLFYHVCKYNGDNTVGNCGFIGNTGNSFIVGKTVIAY